MKSSIDLADWDHLPGCTYFTIAEVGRILRVSQSHVRNAIESGQLAALLLPGQGRGTYRVTKQAVVDYQERSHVQPRMTRKSHTAKQSVGSFFKHLKPTWLPGASRPQDAHAAQQDARNARSCGLIRGPSKVKPS